MSPLPADTNGTNGANGTSFTFRGTFNLGQSYNVNEVVADANGSSYIAIIANNGPSDPANDPYRQEYQSKKHGDRYRALHKR